MEKVAFIILTYKNIEDTVQCIESINDSEIVDCEKVTIVIDNSEDDYYLASIKEKVKVDYSVKIANNGYSDGNNAGIKLAKKIGCEYFFILNNDTIVDKNCVMPLISFLRNNPRSIVSPIIYSYYTKKIWSSGGKKRIILSDYCMLSDDPKCTRKTDFLTGCCMVTTQEVINNIGLFNEDYFMYNEDSDYCFKAKKNNIQMYVIYGSIIFHKVSSSSGAGSPFQLYYIYRNRILFAYENLKGFPKIYCVLVNKLKLIYKITIFRMRRKKEESNALAYALKDCKVKGRFRY